MLGCPNCSEGSRCEGCIEEAINFYPPGHVGRGLTAKQCKLVNYPDVCSTHGLARFNTLTRRCEECTPVAPQRPVGRPRIESARAAARSAGSKTYLGQCAVHGEAEFYVANGRCSGCFTTAGAARTAGALNPRAAARATGASTYFDRCDLHGREEHHVANGRCAMCFTAGGQARKQPTLAQALAALRAAGLGIDEIALLLE